MKRIREVDYVYDREIVRNVLEVGRVNTVIKSTLSTETGFPTLQIYQFT